MSKVRVDSVDVTEHSDFYVIVDKEGKKHTVYFDDHEKIINILMGINEMKYKDCYISAEDIAKELCKTKPELKTNLLRPTGGYYKYYHLSLKVLDHYRFIDYYKDGTILKNKKLTDISPIKRGIQRWLD